MAKKWEYADYTDNEDTKKAKAEVDRISSKKPGEFTYDDYVESDSVTKLRNQLNSLQKPGEYQSQWQKSIDDTINKILNREKFSYDINGDALYQQYKDQYTTQGKMAMMDTMGQAAALTGGYGNSYAQSVGQQTYQGYLQQLNDKIPELYQLALDQYNREGEDLYNQYSLFADREDTDYGRYRDKVSDYNTERNYLTDQYNNDRQWDYGLYSDAYGRAYNQYRDSVSDWQYDLNRADENYWENKNFGYNQYSDNRDLDYTDYRNGIADEQWHTQFEYNKDQDAIANQLAREQFEHNKTQDAIANQLAMEQLKNSKLQGDDDAVIPAGDDSKGVKMFKASIMTQHEYTARGNSRSTYKDYIYKTLEKWLDNEQITEAEAANLMNYYGF